MTTKNQISRYALLKRQYAALEQSHADMMAALEKTVKELRFLVLLCSEEEERGQLLLKRSSIDRAIDALKDARATIEGAKP